MGQARARGTFEQRKAAAEENERIRIAERMRRKEEQQKMIQAVRSARQENVSAGGRISRHAESLLIGALIAMTNTSKHTR